MREAREEGGGTLGLVREWGEFGIGGNDRM